LLTDKQIGKQPCTGPSFNLCIFRGLGTILKLGEQEQEAGLEIISPQTLRLTAEAEASYVKPF